MNPINNKPSQAKLTVPQSHVICEPEAAQVSHPIHQFILSPPFQPESLLSPLKTKQKSPSPNHPPGHKNLLPQSNGPPPNAASPQTKLRKRHPRRRRQIRHRNAPPPARRRDRPGPRPRHTHARHVRARNRRSQIPRNAIRAGCRRTLFSADETGAHQGL